MLGLITAAALAAAIRGVPCEKLPSLSLPETTITTAALVPAGPFVWPEGAFRIPGTENEPPLFLPEHCKVAMVLKPTPDSNINVELWLPEATWNGKFMAVGNGGWAGAIQGYRDMQHILVRGYATANTDMGHTDADGKIGMFALGHREKLIDFAWRATHLMTVRAKQVISAHYRQSPRYSYYTGCSTGGRQGVMAAQRYPGDFDGIIAGALVNRHIHMHTATIAEIIRRLRNPDAVPSDASTALLNSAIMRQCDTRNEGFINNPGQCMFDFSALSCSGAGADGCLTPAQQETVSIYYNGVKNSMGELIFAGAPISVPFTTDLNSAGIRRYAAETDALINPFLLDTVRILGFQNPDYDWNNFNLDRDMPVIDAAAGYVDAVDPDLRAFKARGGKLLLYHGWDDPGVSAQNTIQYFESVLDKLGTDQGDWLRLFLVPGMGHCRGGPGPHAFETINILEKWREKGAAPAQIMGRNPESGLTRPLCPYPQYAKYSGTGNIKDGANWNCAAP
jgi:feruloyl esterase